MIIDLTDNSLDLNNLSFNNLVDLHETGYITTKQLIEALGFDYDEEMKRMNEIKVICDKVFN